MWRLAIIQFFAGLSLKLWPSVAPFFKWCKWCAIMLFLICVIAVSITFFVGCAAIPGALDNVTGSANQQVSKGPLYTYRADLQLTVSGRVFDGMAVTLLSGPIDIGIQSKVGLDRVQVTSCARQDVCQKDQCSEHFTIDSGWFGAAGKSGTYHYQPNQKELEGNCPIYIEAFEKSGLAAWGFVAFRSDEKLSGKMACNGVDWAFAGLSVCQTKGGLDQSLAFDKLILDQEAEPICHMVRKDEKHFDLRPDNGFCRASFYDGENWHRLILLGYDQVLVRGN